MIILEFLKHFLKYLICYIFLQDIEKVIYNPLLSHKKRIDTINKNKKQFGCIASDCSNQETPDPKYPVRECILDICLWREKKV